MVEEERLHSTQEHRCGSFALEEPRAEFKLSPALGRVTL
jgi:hypothetical protein